MQPKIFYPTTVKLIAYLFQGWDWWMDSCKAQAFYRAGSYANDSAKHGAGLELLKKIQIIPRAPHSHGEIKCSPALLVQSTAPLSLK